MSRSSKKGPWVEERLDHVFRRRASVLTDRRSASTRAKHATLPASSSGLAYVAVEGEVQR